jgi:hypothetical protein
MIKNMFRILVATILCAASLSAQAAHLRETERLVTEFSKEISNDFELKLTAWSSSISDELTSLGVFFSGTPAVDIDTARVMTVMMAKRLVTKINEDKNIRRHLGSNQLSIKNINLHITFEDQFGASRTDGSVVHASIMNGRIAYITNEHPTEPIEKRSESETFEEAWGKFSDSLERQRQSNI